ncbi:MULTISPECIES: transcriptional repressor LexA [unclassified Haematospirillum]|uniref:transcriptional repressor LexA n=1 Tax=unclassified Haematospirillum TaxID=2622088 RepID=UPI00143B0390|nr:MULTISPECIES: transcriptional repressor LexA [unclassified Haematospirillum]NKD54379.1 transcriptional repressor LexA [Haematospirillum sp. H4890]NKD74422.1 transcriptional repressor LexA [Haematospirillum sp. H4485]
MLTKKQHQLLCFIDLRLRENGVSPSFDEMKDALGLQSKSGIHRLITGLEERGFIRRLPHRARALEVIRMPERSSGQAGTKGRPDETVRTISHVRSNFGQPLSGIPIPGNSEAVQLPLYGKIAAGTPIEALCDQTSLVEVPASILSGGDHYALTVEGDSMIEAGILDGDTVIIRRCEKAENGTIVVALVDNEEATLKRLRHKGNAIALEPANRTYETRIFGPDRVTVQGQLVGLLRSY